jgi:hypothetical protein
MEFDFGDLLEAVAVSVHLQDVNVMGEAVGLCAGKVFRAESPGPVLEWKVACNQNRSLSWRWMFNSA